MNVLVVEDDPRIADVIEYALAADGHTVRMTQRGREAVQLASSVDFIVLDVGLPDLDGFEVCRLIRKESDAPILFLTSRGDEIDRVVGLEIGGDDYMVKPFSPRELTARIKAIARRQQPSARNGGSNCHAVHYGPVSIDRERFRVTCEGAEVPLTRQEFRLLELLVSQPGRVFTREQLLDQAWGDGGIVTDRTIDVHVKTLRRKFAGLDFIETVRGIGYRVRETPLPAEPE